MSSDNIEWEEDLPDSAYKGIYNRYHAVVQSCDSTYKDVSDIQSDDIFWEDELPESVYGAIQDSLILSDVTHILNGVVATVCEMEESENFRASLQSGSGKRKIDDSYDSDSDIEIIEIVPKKPKVEDFKWQLISTKQREIPRFRAVTTDSIIELRHKMNTTELLDSEADIDEIFQNFIEPYAANASPNDRVTVTVSHNLLEKPIYINSAKKDLHKLKFLERLHRRAQSSKFLEDGRLQITVNVIQNVRGGRNSRLSAPLSPETRATISRCIVRIKSRDNSCGYLCIALGKCLADGDVKRYKTMVRQNNQTLRKAALELCSATQINIDSPMSIAIEVPRLQSHLSNYQIVIVDGASKEKLFLGPPSFNRIALVYHANHYDFINNLNSFMGGNFCINCWRNFGHSFVHKCPHGCEMCLSSSKCGNAASVMCNDCNRNFYSDACFQRHKEYKICASIRICSVCKFEYSDDLHVCDKYRCYKCLIEYTESPHYCMMRKLKLSHLKKEDEKLKYILCYDIESMQVNEENVGLVHKPVLLISKLACNKCDDNEGCSTCANALKMFRGINCVVKFCDYLFNLALKLNNKARIFVFAHNQQGYDGHFIIREVFNRNFRGEKVVMKGSKILKLTVGNVIFIDSLSFFFQPLDKLPKSFGFESLVKGHFPHLFNTPENQTYVGRFPEVSMYSHDYMKPEAKAKFLSWYEENKHKQFAMQDEMQRYCQNDVIILMKAIMEFRKLFSSITGLDPITRNFTLASIGLEYFRAQILKDNTMAITPVAPYSKGRKSSRKENVWLDWMQLTDGEIKRQQRVGCYYCDGKQGNKIYEFWGCYYHGCPKCFPAETLPEDSQIMQHLRFLKTEERKENYRQRNFNLIEIWEHDFDKLNTAEFKLYAKARNAFYNRKGEKSFLNIRDSFFGGRTNNIYFYYECKPDEEIFYVDFTSLYPYVLYKYKYPIGHPEVIEEEFQPISEYFGFVKCSVLAPANLYIPVLPVRIDNKLMFTLCVKCAIERNQSPCGHSRNDRIFTGTWSTVELQEALNQGYEVIEIFEVLHYNSEKCSDNLFKDYILKWLKIKVESSGWPSDCLTDAQKQQYIIDFQRKQNIKLNHSQISKNEGKRFIAKLMLNSLWGKFAQRSNLRKTAILRDYDEYMKHLIDPEIEIIGEFEANENVRILEYEKKEDCDTEPGQTNIAVASYTTSYARRELLWLIQEIEAVRRGRVLYFDTDSVIFIHKSSDPQINTGNYLGELTNEISGKYGGGARCTTFVSCGPKNYGYEVLLPDGSKKVDIKVKGLTLHSKSLDVISFKKMLEMAKNYSEGGDMETLSVPQFNIVTNKRDHIVKTKNFHKKYRVLSEKRRINGQSTLPYGFHY